MVRIAFALDCRHRKVIGLGGHHPGIEMVRDVMAGCVEQGFAALRAADRQFESDSRHQLFNLSHQPRITAMYKLYYAPGTCALATHIALEEAAAPYEAIRVDFASQAQRSAEYLAINPKGRVPALVTERGTLTETPGLLLFVAQQFPAAELAPLTDAFALAQVQEFNSYLCATVHVAHAHGRRGARWADDVAAHEAMKRKVPASMTECAELVEHKFLRGPWIMGEQYTICDPYWFTIGTWLEGDGVDTSRLPRILEHRRRMLTRAAVQKAVSIEGTQIP